MGSCCGRRRERTVLPKPTSSLDLEGEVAEACWRVQHTVRAWRVECMASRANAHSAHQRQEVASAIVGEIAWMRQHWRVVADTFEQADDELAVEAEAFGVITRL